MTTSTPSPSSATTAVAAASSPPPSSPANTLTSPATAKPSPGNAAPASAPKSTPTPTAPKLNPSTPASAAPPLLGKTADQALPTLPANPATLKTNLPTSCIKAGKPRTMDEAAGLSGADRLALVLYYQAQAKADLADHTAKSKTLTAQYARLARLADAIKIEAGKEQEAADWKKATAGLTAAQVAEAVAAYKAAQQAKR